MLKRINNEKGMALLTAVMILLVLSIFSIMVIQVATSDTFQNAADESFSENYYLSRSAVDMISREIKTAANNDEFITALGKKEYVKYFPSEGGTYDHTVTFTLDPADPTSTVTTTVSVTNERVVDSATSTIKNYITVTGTTTDHIGRASKASSSMLISVKYNSSPPVNPFAGAITIQPGGFLGFSARVSSIDTSDNEFPENEEGTNIVPPFYTESGKLEGNIEWAKKVPGSSPELYEVKYQKLSDESPVIVQVLADDPSIICFPDSYYEPDDEGVASRQYAASSYDSYISTNGVVTLIKNLIASGYDNIADIKKELFAKDPWGNYTTFNDDNTFGRGFEKFINEHPEFIAQFLTPPTIPKYSIEIPPKDNTPARVLQINLMEWLVYEKGISPSQAVGVSEFKLSEILTPTLLASYDSFIISFEPIWEKVSWWSEPWNDYYQWWPGGSYAPKDSPPPITPKKDIYNSQRRCVVVDKVIEIPAKKQLTIVFNEICGDDSKGLNFAEEGAFRVKDSDVASTNSPEKNASVNILVQQPPETDGVDQCHFPIMGEGNIKTYPNCPLYIFVPDGLVYLRGGAQTPIFGSIYARDVQCQNNITFCYIPTSKSIPFLKYEGNYSNTGNEPSENPPPPSGYTKESVTSPVWIKPE